MKTGTGRARQTWDGLPLLPAFFFTALSSSRCVANRPQHRELARPRRGAGSEADFREGAAAPYEKVREMYREQEITPVVDLSDDKPGTAVFSNDRVMNYDGEDYERLYAHFLEAQNYLLLNQPREALGEKNEVLIHYRQALELEPESPHIAGALTRLAQDFDPERAKDIAARFDFELEDCDPKQPHLVLFFESEWTPAKSEKKITIPDIVFEADCEVGTPFYAESRENQRNYPIQSDGTALKSPELVSRTVLLAENDLDEAFPGLVLRQGARILGQTALRGGAKKADEGALEAQQRGNDEEALILAGVSSVSSFAAIFTTPAMAQADTRSWLALPARASGYPGYRSDTGDTGHFMRMDQLYPNAGQTIQAKQTMTHRTNKGT